MKVYADIVANASCEMSMPFCVERSVIMKSPTLQSTYCCHSVDFIMLATKAVTNSSPKRKKIDCSVSPDLSWKMRRLMPRSSRSCLKIDCMAWMKNGLEVSSGKNACLYTKNTQVNELRHIERIFVAPNVS